MKENEDYIISQDPTQQSETEWVVILKNCEWNDFVIKFKDISIVDYGHTINYTLDLMYAPQNFEFKDKDQERFEKHCGLICAASIQSFHKRNANIYIDQKTGNRVEY